MKDIFYPPTINRAVALVIPKKPFYDWNKSVFPDVPPMDRFNDYTSYLLKDSIVGDEPKKVLKNHWEWIFAQELFGICTNEEKWPQKRTWKLFNEWFDIKFSTIVIDLVEQPIIQEEL